MANSSGYPFKVQVNVYFYSEGTEQHTGLPRCNNCNEE